MFLFNPADKIMNIAALVLEARLTTDANSAIPIWRRAVEAQDALSYDDPPAWYYWIRQSLGAALLRSGRAAEAESVFREGLRALREIHAFSLAFGSVSKLRRDLQTPVGFSVSLQPHGVVEIRQNSRHIEDF
jgi:hypothetical protein